MAKTQSNAPAQPDVPAQAGDAAQTPAPNTAGTDAVLSEAQKLEAHLKVSIMLINGIISEIEVMMDEFITDVNFQNTLTGTERKRLVGAGLRNYGFIEKSLDIASENPQFNPPNFSTQRMGQEYLEFEHVRQLSFVLQQFSQIVNDYMMLSSNSLYRDALRIYGSLREQSRNRVPGADPLFQALMRFFRTRRRRHTSAEPTAHELEMDFHRLIHGKADGEMIIRHEAGHTGGGVHTVIDDVHKRHGAIDKGN